MSFLQRYETPCNIVNPCNVMSRLQRYEQASGDGGAESFFQGPHHERRPSKQDRRVSFERKVSAIQGRYFERYASH